VALLIPESTELGMHHVEVDDASLEALLDGVEVEATSRPRRARARVH
jgi:hypothetical protein